MTRRTSIRIPAALYAWLSEQAQHERRTISNLIVALLSAAKDNHTDTRTDAADRGETPPSRREDTAS
jgi:macrodomain Ter protein organizer (MatP/YcbG family)